MPAPSLYSMMFQGPQDTARPAACINATTPEKGGINP